MGRSAHTAGDGWQRYRQEQAREGLGVGRRRADEKDEWAGEELKIKGEENNQEMKRVRKRVDLQSRMGKVKMRLANPPGRTEDTKMLRGVKINVQWKRKKYGGMHRKFRCATRFAEEHTNVHTLWKKKNP